MRKNLYLDLHVIQTVPPSCVNRDDTGSPKTAIYGGTMRARVSSQAWKRAMRLMFRDLFASEQVGYRTKNAVTMVAEKILEKDPRQDPETAKNMAAELLELAGVKSESGKKDVLFFISEKQIEAAAGLAEEYGALTKAEKKSQDKAFKARANQVLTEEPGIDMLLFGRMAANNPSLNYDAASQVAHSISTHTVSNEYDYFTAVDDCAPQDNAGAGHLGTVEFNASTLYRYATVNIRELSENLNPEELRAAVRGFTDAFIRSMPTGKQNTFANRTLPDLVYAAIRDDQTVNFSGAFERPVRAGSDGYVKRSVEALFDHASGVYENFVPEPLYSWTVGMQDPPLGEKTTLRGLLDQIDEAVAQYAADED